MLIATMLAVVMARREQQWGKGGGEVEISKEFCHHHVFQQHISLAGTSQMYLIHRRVRSCRSNGNSIVKICENHSPDVFMAKNIDGSET